MKSYVVTFFTDLRSLKMSTAIFYIMCIINVYHKFFVSFYTNFDAVLFLSSGIRITANFMSLRIKRIQMCQNVTWTFAAVIIV